MMRFRDKQVRWVVLRLVTLKSMHTRGKRTEPIMQIWYFVQFTTSSSSFCYPPTLILLPSPILLYKSLLPAKRPNVHFPSLPTHITKETICVEDLQIMTACITVFPFRGIQRIDLMRKKSLGFSFTACAVLACSGRSPFLRSRRMRYLRSVPSFVPRKTHLLATVPTSHILDALLSRLCQDQNVMMMVSCMDKLQLMKKEMTYPQILVRSLLVLFRHGLCVSACKHSYKGEKTEGSCDTDHGVCEDLETFSWWCLGARTVFAEGNVVCCSRMLVSLCSVERRVWRVWGVNACN